MKKAIWLVLQSVAWLVFGIAIERFDLITSSAYLALYGYIFGYVSMAVYSSIEDKK